MTYIRECYKIVHDEQAVLDFVDWLPDNDEQSAYYLALFSRKKYAPEVKWIRSDKMQLGRKTCKKERLLNKLYQLEVPIGAYQNDGKSVPHHSLAVYITPNPRDLWRANFRSLCKLAKVIEGNNKAANPHQEVMSEIQKTAATKTFITFDLDDKDETALEECLKIVDFKADVIKTRGGYHIHVIKSLIMNFHDKKWYPKLAERCDVCGDEMTPVVGTIQGGFVPKFKFRHAVDA